jgi:hypothetical protein
MTSATLLAFAALAAVAGAWYANLRARERANALAAETCRKRGLQLLDGTVALGGLRLRRGHGGPEVERTYVFDYSGDGVRRRSGFIILRGERLVSIGLEDDTPAPPLRP